MELHTFCKKLPKIELHAHLNGSLTPATLQKLHKIHDPESTDNIVKSMHLEEATSLDECFKVFAVAHSLTTTPETVYAAACDVIEDFFLDNVIYLELRTTPRSHKNMTKRKYVEAVIKAIETCKSRFPEILVKLLISAGREKGYADCEENMNLAIALSKEHSDIILGIDLSGDPKKGSALIDLLIKCREAGLKIAAHCAEIPNETEVIDILNFKPDRLGHCTCIHPNLKGSKKVFEMFLKAKIPVELCPTSNVKCKTVPSYEFHQFKYYYDSKHPLCIATDDKGVFNTTLSNEFEIVGKFFNLTKNELKEISRLAVNYSFATIEEKEALKKVIDAYN